MPAARAKSPGPAARTDSTDWQAKYNALKAGDADALKADPAAKLRVPSCSSIWPKLSDPTFLLSVFSFLSLVFYYESVLSLSRQSNRASLYNTIHGEYSRPEVLDAFDAIEDWRDMHGSSEGGYGVAYANKRFAPGARRLPQLLPSDGGVTVRQVDHARRLLVSFWSKIAIFSKFGLMDTSLIERFPGREKARYFLRLVEPLAVAAAHKNNRTVSPTFQEIRELYGLAVECGA
jgi:hypothetical protein